MSRCEDCDKGYCRTHCRHEMIFDDVWFGNDDGGEWGVCLMCKFCGFFELPTRADRLNKLYKIVPIKDCEK